MPEPSPGEQARLARPRHALSCVHRHYVYGELRIPFEAEVGHLPALCVARVLSHSSGGWLVGRVDARS